MCCQYAYVKEKLSGIFIILLRQNQGHVTLYISLVPLVLIITNNKLVYDLWKLHGIQLHFVMYFNDVFFNVCICFIYSINSV